MREDRLHADQKAFDKRIPSLIADGHAGEYVVFKDGEIHGFFPDESQAFDSAIARFGVGTPFVIDHVAEKKPSCVSVSWDLGLMLVSR